MLFDFDTLRRRLLPTEVDALRARNLLIDESHRRRPRYFDGRFLAARDLTRDQAYFLARQAAYARALGPGVVEGLEVSRGARADVLRVTSGFGYTPAGEIVSLSRPVDVSLADMPALQLLNTRLRLDTLKRPPLRNRTGIFAVGLRPLEFTANPIAAYPSGLDRERTVEAGDVVEAAALALFPLADAAPTTVDATRRQLARAAFVDRELPPIPAEILPLAVVALTGDNVRWIDVHVVRRQAGQAHSDVLGFGFAPRLLREAHLAHYREQLAELRGRSFSAPQFFDALPPAGPLPAGAINAQDFSQSFFPAGITTELSIVPDDELPGLVEESMSLPPIDLTEPAESLQSVFVSILIPVPRAQVRALAQRLSGALQRVTRPVLTTLAVRRLPLDRLRLITTPFITRPTFDPNLLIDNAWRAALEAAGGAEGLWFARRRNLAYNESIAGRTVPVTTAQPNLEVVVTNRMRDLGLLTRFRELSERADVFGRAELTRVLAAPALATPVLAGTVLTALEAVAVPEGERLTASDVVDAAAPFSQPGVGEGLARLAEVNPELVSDRATVRRLVSSGQVLEIDRHLSTVNPAEVTRVAGEIERLRPGGRIELPPVSRPPR
jgi:hypothetical protein